MEGDGKRTRHRRDARRPYRMRKRREEIDETRRRIIEATVELHATVGPAHATFSAVAEKADVQRSTVYRHFADEEALFGACTSHWLAEHPWPRAEAWSAIADPAERLRLGLRELYRYYEHNERMLFNSYRDFALMPAFVGEFMRAQVRSLHAALLAGWPVRGSARRRLAAALSLAIDFRAWQALAGTGLGSQDAAELVTDLIASTGAVTPPRAAKD
jgi:AcrR family transcriptional regulator